VARYIIVTLDEKYLYDVEADRVLLSSSEKERGNAIAVVDSTIKDRTTYIWIVMCPQGIFKGGEWNNVYIGYPPEDVGISKQFDAKFGKN